MALRLASKRVISSLSSRAFPAAIDSQCRRRYASTATATATASSLPESVKSDILKEASLPNPDPPADSATTAFIKDNAPYMVPTYVRPPPVMTAGDGCYLWDLENRQYLDFTAGIAVNALGHNDPELVKLISQQSRTLIHASNLYHNPWTPSLSKLLIESTRSQSRSPSSPNALTQSFISNSGSEANEAAIKFARKVGHSLDPSGAKHEILSFHNSFHGRTMGSLSATPNPKYQTPFAPMLPGFKYSAFNDVPALPSLITDNTCGVIVEPIQGEGGINVATPEFLSALREHCTRVGAVLIFDEIQCGLSRTGTLWAHAQREYPSSVYPDILTSAKALGNGVPIGATLINDSVASHIKTGDHGTTFGGNPLACRVAHYVFSRISSPQFQASVRSKSLFFISALNALSNAHPGLVSEIRGRGLILGAQLANPALAPKIVTAARERGLLIITAGEGCMRFLPPLTISEPEIEQGMRILDSAIQAVLEAEKGEIKGTGGQQEMKTQ